MKHSVRWDQVLDNPAVGTNSSTGIATVQGGDLVVPEGYKVTFLYENPQPTEKEWDGSTRIVGIEVSKANGDMVFAYKPMNPGQYASIQADISGVGDGYARINANVLVSNDPGAPRLNTLLITNGTNSFIHLPKEFPVGNGAYDLIGCINPCLMQGTWINQGHGTVALIEELVVGDLIMTLDHGLQRIVHITKREFSDEEVKANPKLIPFIYNLDGWGNEGSADALYISRHHRILHEGVLITANHLANCRSNISRQAENWFGPVVWFNIYTEQHEIIVADGFCVETGWLGGNMAERALGPDWDYVKHLRQDQPCRPFVEKI